MRARVGVVAVALLALGGCGAFGSDAPAPSDAGAGADADANADANAEAAASTADGGSTKLVFISKQTLKPGTAFADGRRLLCMEEAEDAGIPTNRPFVAWLSTGGSDAIAAITSEGVWALPGGAVVFPSRTAILESKLSHVIDEYADGLRAPRAMVWTGTNADGSQSASVCAGTDGTAWTSTVGNGTVGDPTTTLDGRWTNGTAAACNADRSVVCFEQ